MSATPESTLADPKDRLIADLQQQLAASNAERDKALAERDEALAQQEATTEVVQVINSSPGDLAPVVDTILEKATRLCDAKFGALSLYRGDDRHEVIATRAMPPEVAKLFDAGPVYLGPETGMGRLVRGEPFVHIPDASDDEGYRQGNPVRRALVDIAGTRAYLAMPMRKDGALLGAFTIYRQEIRPFTDKQIALLQNFAAQAVIAMENARLLIETQEALDQQTATAEVLQVINASPGDLAPVFDAMLEKALRLCGAAFGQLGIYDGELLSIGAVRGPADIVTFMKNRGPVRSIKSHHSTIERLWRGEDVIHIADAKDDLAYRKGNPNRRALVDLGGCRTLLTMALRKDRRLLGAIEVYRQEVRPFTDKQIALVQNFAAQAVIAIENARLLTETREALEQQTATAEVLRVINASPGNLTPVFEALLEKAMRLCEASFGYLLTYDGERLHSAADCGHPAFAAWVRAQGAINPEPGTTNARLVAGEDVVHIPDVTNDPGLSGSSSVRQAAIEIGGFRTILSVALRKDNALLGVLHVYRQEVRPFSGKHVALLQNFASQAVIAMDNARLLTETREALEQQTATGEVLQVINSSPGDLTPVFETILDKAHSLCGAERGTLFLFDGGTLRAAVTHGYPDGVAERLRAGVKVSETTVFDPLLAGAPLVHNPDLRLVDDPTARAVSGPGGVRTNLLLALRKDSALLGLISCNRTEVRPFSEKEIALLQNFAAQAVIAIENARLITETREALDRQTATSEILRAIAAAPGDAEGTLNKIAETTSRLFGASGVAFRIAEGDEFKMTIDVGRGAKEVSAALYGRTSPRLTVRSRALPGTVIRENRQIHIPDLDNLPSEMADWPGPPVLRAAGVRTIVGTPLRREGQAFGALNVYRDLLHPFTSDELDLLQSFADQAAIAIENARLIAETREALEQQTATAEVLGVINTSPGNLAPVFDAMLQRATRLCGAETGHLFRFEEGAFLRLASDGVPERFNELLPPDTKLPLIPNSLPERMIAIRSAVHVRDLREDESYRLGAPHEVSAVEAGIRTVLFVPLLKEGEVVGHFTMHRNEVKPFSEKQIALLQNFAAQAVIAMENARLLNELREALEQQQAIAEILQVINRSPGELQPVFDILLEKAMRLCGAAFGILAVLDGEQAHTVAAQGVPSALAEWRQTNPVVNSKNTLLMRVIAGEPYVHTLDLKDDHNYERGEPLRRANVDLGGARTSLYVPLKRDREVLGTLHIYRQEVRPFSDKQIALLQNFAAQAVIAIENARLLNEVRQRQEELRITFENMGDGVAMFDETSRLIAWNRKFQDMLDLSDDVFANRPTYAEYLRLLAERGEFGKENVEMELSRRLDAMNEELRLERTRPNGRVLEVRRNAVPDGGFVLIYSDITERKRSEAEIRAARDAAETALRNLQAAQASLIQAQKMAALGQLTAGIAHEIKNPLNFVNNFAGLSVELLDELKESAAQGIAMLDEDTRADIDETIEMLTGNLDKIAEHGKRADNIVKSMLEHSRGVSGERRAVDLNALIDEALKLAYHGARAQDQSFNITLERDYQPGLAPIEMAPQEITRVFLNLFGNGFYASTKRQREGNDPQFKPTLKVTTRAAGDGVAITVRDNGTGIPPEIKDRLFQPFLTTKPTGEGTGLGLSISYDIVTQQHGGTITVESEPAAYSEFTIRLPRRASAAGAA